MNYYSSIRWMIVAAVIVTAGWIAAMELIEAYGSGPPFFGRTTNMDKWSSPWPTIGAVSAVAVLLAFLIAPRRR